MDRARAGFFAPVPDEELPNVLSAIEEGRCVTCYGPITDECGGSHEFYCHGCDDGCVREENGNVG